MTRHPQDQSHEFALLKLEQDLESKDLELQKVVAEFHSYKEESETLLEEARYRTNQLSEQLKSLTEQLDRAADLEKQLSVSGICKM